MADFWKTENLWSDRPFEPDTAYCSLTLVSTLLNWFETQGFENRQLLSGTGIDPERLSELNYNVNYVKYRKLMQNAHDLWGDDQLGLRYGLELRFTSFGIVGHAAITSPTIRTALDIFTRFFTLKVRYIHFEVEHDGSDLKFSFYSELPDTFVSRFHLDSSLGSLLRLFTQVYNQPTEFQVLLSHFGGNNPEVYETAFEGNVKFGSTENALIFRNVDLDRPSHFANPISSKLGVKYCEIEYQAMKRSRMLEQISSYDIVGEIQSALSANLSNPPPLSRLSRDLGMSERNLRRLISDFGLSYRQILNDTRAEYSAAKLKNSSMAISLIARELGYENAANFSRAFKKWFGVSPVEYRKTTAEFLKK